MPCPEQLADQEPRVADFEDLGLGEELLRGIYAYGLENPSGLQGRCLPSMLSSRDVVVIAQSGTGKTAAYCIALLSKLDPTVDRCQALVILPSRELACAVQNVVSELADYFLDGRRVRATVCVRLLEGEGAPSASDETLNTSHVILGTPGDVVTRLFGTGQWRLCLDSLMMLIIDEMNDLQSRGFADEIRRIFFVLGRGAKPTKSAGKTAKSAGKTGVEGVAAVLAAPPADENIAGCGPSTGTKLPPAFFAAGAVDPTCADGETMDIRQSTLNVDVAVPSASPAAGGPFRGCVPLIQCCVLCRPVHGSEIPCDGLELLIDPVTVIEQQDLLSLACVRQCCVRLESEEEKIGAVREALEAPFTRAVIYCRSQRKAGWLIEKMADWSPLLIHFDMDQAQRATAWQHFNSGEKSLLIATDGLHGRNSSFTGVEVKTLIINYDLPANVENYVHRLSGFNFPELFVRRDNQQNCRFNTIINFMVAQEEQLMREICEYYKCDIPQFDGASASAWLNAGGGAHAGTDD